MELTLDTHITQLPGVGEVRGKKLGKLGLLRVTDLLHYYPRDYEDRRRVCSIQDAPLGEKVCIHVLAAEPPRLSRVRKGLELVQVKTADHTGVLHLSFFNQSYMQRVIGAGEEYVLFGVIQQQGLRRSMVNPVVEPASRPQVTGRIMPIYPLTAGISNHLLASLTRQALSCVSQLPETLPQAIRGQYHLAGVEYAISSIHFPPGDEALAQAKRRLAFEELFYLFVGLRRLKERRTGAQGVAIAARPIEEFLALLPFPPTPAQRRVMEEIAGDLRNPQPMNRLIQGDVGSGKTMVAAFAGWLAVKSGGQAALMAPTEVLAEQHMRSLSALLAPAGVRVGLLSGTLTPAEKAKRKKALSQGEIDLVVGTHALISQGVRFSNLTLMIADEQHRFGVVQRGALAEKGVSPHVLVMSATPIPRTLALIVYGDLEVSVIDELPPGRIQAETYLIREDKRERMYAFVRRQAALGRQVYIICPAVEEEEGNGGLKAATTHADHLQKTVFPQLRVELLHGRMKPKEKERVMTAFSGGEIQVLVSTTVVEVGVDVPNATLMVIENADRFGLSQLHQLRGRVGRGAHQSYCVLVTDTKNPDTMARLRTLVSTTDGFKISEEDLKARGPGDFFGNRQHGLPQMKLADLVGDMPLLNQAQEAAKRLLQDDPQLSSPDNHPVLAQVRRLFTQTPDIFN